MIVENVQIPTPDGAPEALFYHADDGVPRPGVLLFTDIGGIGEAFEGLALRLADEGYSVLMPNVFYRTGKPPLFDVPFHTGGEQVRKRFEELRAPLTPEAIERDAGAYVDFLAAQPSVRPGPMGVVGYCFTGSLALRTAAVRPDQIAAVASFHGGGLFTSAATSPHLVLPRVKARLYFGHASNDRSMPAEAIEKFNQALAAWGGKYESEVYEGAGHGWTVPGSPVYHREQAERAFAKLKQLLAEALP